MGVRGGPGLIVIFEVWVVLVVVVLDVGHLVVVAGTVVGQVYTPGVMATININPVEVEVPTIVVLISQILAVLTAVMVVSSSPNYKIDIHYMEANAIEPTPEEIAAQEVVQKRKVEAMTKLRSERDALIPSTDKYVMRDYPINDETFKKWKLYRQLLRDLPGMSSPDLDEDGNLKDVEWPTPPQ
jgi:uncharacterized membrane protein YgaE (UPF0421/DUF939 family)